MTRPRRPHRTRLYRNGASQAVRIPKDLAWSEDIEVELVRRGDEVVVRPARRSLTCLGDALQRMGRGMEGFRREEGEDQERDWSGLKGGQGGAQREAPVGDGPGSAGSPLDAERQPASQAMRGTDAALIERMEGHPVGELVISAITLGELKHGSRAGHGDRANAEPFLAFVPVLPFDAAAAAGFGR